MSGNLVGQYMTQPSMCNAHGAEKCGLIAEEMQPDAPLGPAMTIVASPLKGVNGKRSSHFFLTKKSTLYSPLADDPYSAAASEVDVGAAAAAFPSASAWAPEAKRSRRGRLQASDDSVLANNSCDRCADGGGSLMLEHQHSLEHPNASLDDCIAASQQQQLQQHWKPPEAAAVVAAAVASMPHRESSAHASGVCQPEVQQLQQSAAESGAENALKQRQKQLVGSVYEAVSSLPDIQLDSTGLRQILSVPALAGLRVEHRKTTGPATAVSGCGSLTAEGLILCGCDSCQISAQPISLSAFEGHSGSLQNCPPDNIYLSDYNLSLRKLTNLVTAMASIHLYQEQDRANTAAAAAAAAACAGDFPIVRELESSAQQQQQQQHAEQQAEQQEPEAKLLSLEQQIQNDFAEYFSKLEQAPQRQQLPFQHSLVLLEDPPVGANPRRSSTYTFVRPSPEIGELPLIKFDPSNLRPISLIVDWQQLPVRPMHDSGWARGYVHVHNAEEIAAQAMAGCGGGGGSSGSSGRNSNKNRRIFDGEPGGLKHGERVNYTIYRKQVLGGSVHCDTSGEGKHGILCDHCDEVISCSTFESHAGHSNRRNPYTSIFTEEGLSLKDIAARLPEQVFVPSGRVGSGGGACGSGMHRLKKNSGSGRGKLSRLAPPHISAEDGVVVDEAVDRCSAAMAELEALPSSCSVCFRTDFDKDNFSDRTVIICDQCEREFHVGCLRSSGRGGLDAVPQGDWFCGTECSRVRGDLLELVEQGEVECSEEGHTWQVFHGEDGSNSTSSALAVVQNILQESFDPIIDVLTGSDLLPKMVDAGALGDWHFEGMFSVLFKHRGRPVCAAVFRVFGAFIAELPLIATKFDARRQGHCRVLMVAIEAALKGMGVPTLALPAATSAMPTWLHGFNFKHADLNELQAVLPEVRLLVFPGTQVLYKTLIKREPLDPSVPSFELASWPGAAARAAAGSTKLVQIHFAWHENSTDPALSFVTVKISPSLAALALSLAPLSLAAASSARPAHAPPPTSKTAAKASVCEPRRDLSATANEARHATNSEAAAAAALRAETSGKSEQTGGVAGAPSTQLPPPPEDGAEALSPARAHGSSARRRRGSAGAASGGNGFAGAAIGEKGSAGGAGGGKGSSAVAAGGRAANSRARLSLNGCGLVERPVQSSRQDRADAAAAAAAAGQDKPCSNGGGGGNAHTTGGDANGCSRSRGAAEECAAPPSSGRTAMQVDDAAGTAGISARTKRAAIAAKLSRAEIDGGAGGGAESSAGAGGRATRHSAREPAESTPIKEESEAPLSSGPAAMYVDDATGTAGASARPTRAAVAAKLSRAKTCEGGGAALSTGAGGRATRHSAQEPAESTPIKEESAVPPPSGSTAMQVDDVTGTAGASARPTRAAAAAKLSRAETCESWGGGAESSAGAGGRATRQGTRQPAESTPIMDTAPPTRRGSMRHSEGVTESLPSMESPRTTRWGGGHPSREGPRATHASGAQPSEEAPRAARGSGVEASMENPKATRTSEGEPIKEGLKETHGSEGGSSMENPRATRRSEGEPIKESLEGTRGSEGGPIKEGLKATRGSGPASSMENPRATRGSGGEQSKEGPRASGGSGAEPSMESPKATRWSGGEQRKEGLKATGGSGAEPSMESPRATRGNGAEPSKESPRATRGSEGGPFKENLRATRGSEGEPIKKGLRATRRSGVGQSMENPSATCGSEGEPVKEGPRATRGSGGDSQCRAPQPAPSPKVDDKKVQARRGSGRLESATVKEEEKEEGRVTRNKSRLSY